MARRKRRKAPLDSTARVEHQQPGATPPGATRATDGRDAPVGPPVAIDERDTSPATSQTTAAGLRGWLSRPAVALVVPLALAALAYARVLDGEFQFDDQLTIQQNLAVKNLGGFLRSHLASSFGQRPVTDLTFALNYAVAGLEPWNFHITNLAIHLAAVVLVFAFTRTVLRLAGAANGEWVAVAVAGVFALHPIQSESVSYVSQRAESLASALYVATMILVVAAERRGLTRRGAPVWIGAFACFVVGLGVKPILVTLPAAWLLLGAVVPSRSRRCELLPWGKRALAVVPFLAFDAWLVSRALGATTGSVHAGFSVPGLPPGSYFLTQLRVIPVYIRLLFWPSGQNVDWDFPASRSLAEPSVLLSGLFLVALAGGAVWAARAMRSRQGPGSAAVRVAAYGVMWFFVSLSLTSSFVPLVDVFVEHRLYLAAWGIFVAVAVGVERALAWIPPGRAVAAAAVIVSLTWAAPAAALHRRNAVWETRRALWEDAAAKSPRKARPHLSLGYAAIQEGRLADAVRSSTVALGLAGEDLVMELQILRNLGASYLLLGRFDEAEDVLRLAYAKGPWNVEIMNNLAATLMAQGRLDDAESVARRATEVQPERGTPWNVLGEISLRRGRYDEALRLFERSIRCDPDVALRHFNRGQALAGLGRAREACAIWRALDPGSDAVLRAKWRGAWSEHRCDARGSSR